MSDAPGSRRPERSASGGANLLPFVERLAKTLDLQPGSTELRKLLTEGIALGAAKALGLPRYPEPLAGADTFTTARLEREFAAQIEPAGDTLDRLLRAGRLYETVSELMSVDGRRASGSYFTPPGIARYVAASASEGLTASSFCDPACGAGHLLSALRILGEVPLDRLYGIDIDPVAAHLARVMLWLADGGTPGAFRTVNANIRAGDALKIPFPPAEVTVSNPPFVKGVSRQTAGETRDRTRLRKALPGLQGAFDLASAFWALAEREKCRRAVFVLPNRLLAAGYTAKLRDAAVIRGDSVTIRDFSRAKAFGPAVAVYPVVVTLNRDGRGLGTTAGGAVEFRWKTRLLKGRSWSAALSADAMRILEADPLRLGDVAAVAAGQTTAEAYETAKKIGSKGEFLFVTAGTIEPHRLLKEEPQRFLGKTLRSPRITAKALGPRRAETARTPKLLVAAMGKRIEAVLDLKGEIAPAVSVFTVIPAPGGPFGLGALAAILNSRALEGVFTALYGAQAMSGGHISVTKAMLNDLPVATRTAPERIRRLEALGLALAELPESAELLEAVDEEVLGLMRQ